MHVRYHIIILPHDNKTTTKQYKNRVMDAIDLPCMDI